MAELDAIRSRIGHCRAGDAVATTAGNLPADWVIHAVGPVYHGGAHQEAETLASCHRRCLALADGRGASSLTLPAISTGVYGYPLDEAAQVAVRTVGRILASSDTKVERVAFVLFGNSAVRAFARAALRQLPRFG